MRGAFMKARCEKVDAELAGRASIAQRRAEQARHYEK
jgi:hypothetical protein